MERLRRIALWVFATIALLLAGWGTPVAHGAPMPTSSLLPRSLTEVPPADYPVPAGALFVSPDGSDSNPGTQEAPLRTLNHALTRVASGQTVVMRGGVYREGASGYATGGTFYVSRMSNVTIQAYPNEQVWLDGTEIVSNWTRVSATHFQVAWSTPNLCAGQYYSNSYASQTSSGPCSYPDAIGGRSSLGNPQMLYRDGTALREVATLAELAEDTFFYDQAAQVMHIGFDPAASTVEITKHPQALALFQANNVTIRGIGIRRYASNQFGNATQGALLLNAGSNVTLEKVTITGNAGVGLISWNTRNLVLSQVVISHNGANGFNMAGAQPKLVNDPTARDDLTIEYSRVEHNNADGYAIDCTVSCNASGVKLAGVIGATVRYSTFNYNGGMRASGLWFDLACSQAQVYGNKMIGNSRHGLVFEVSSDAVLASNLIADNGWGATNGGGGYGMMVGSANVRIWNNTVVNNKMGVFLYDDPRSPGVDWGVDPSRVGPNSLNIDFVNNIVTTNSSSSSHLVFVSGGSQANPGNTSDQQTIRQLESNSYSRPSNVGFSYWRDWTENRIVPYGEVAQVQAAKGDRRETGSHLVDAVPTPYLVNPNIGDYTLRPGAQPVGSGQPLPSDIAELLGLPAGVAVDRGTLTLGG